MNIQIEPYRPAYNAIMKKLDSVVADSQNAVKNAVNDTAKHLKDELHLAVRETYSIKASEFRKADIKKKNATRNRMEAVISVSGAPPSLFSSYKYYKNTKHKAVRAVVKSSGGKKDLQLSGGSYKAFIATMNNGHTAIFQRRPGSHMKQGGRSREKIKQISAMAKSKAAEMTYKEQLHDDTAEYLNLMLHKQINMALGGK